MASHLKRPESGMHTTRTSKNGQRRHTIPVCSARMLPFCGKSVGKGSAAGLASGHVAGVVSFSNISFPLVTHNCTALVPVWESKLASYAVKPFLSLTSDIVAFSYRVLAYEGARLESQSSRQMTRNLCLRAKPFCTILKSIARRITATPIGSGLPHAPLRSCLRKCTCPNPASGRKTLAAS